MKSILFSVTTDLNYDQRMQRICGSLARHGYQVTLLGRQWPHSQPLRQQPYRQYRLRCYFSKGKLFYAEYNLRLFCYLLFHRFDAYCGIDLDTVVPMFLVAKLRRKPFIYDAHEYFPEVIEVARRPAIKKIWEAVEGWIVPRTPYAYTVTASIAAIFREKYGTRFAVIRNISSLGTAAVPEKKRKFILYQGVVNEGRGLEQLIDALPQLQTDLVICGKGDVFEALQQRVRQLGLQERVVFKGYVLPQELKAITNEAWLGYSLLQNLGLSYYYSLSNKFFDYVHAGVPQLAPDFPEYRTLNEQYGVALLTGLSVEEIVAAVRKLEEQPALYERLQQNCFAARQELNWEEEEKKLLDYYRQIWQKKPEKIVT